MPGCGGARTVYLPEISTEITPEFIERMEAHDAKLESLKESDPKEYARVTTATARLQRWFAAAKLQFLK